MCYYGSNSLISIIEHCLIEQTPYCTLWLSIYYDVFLEIRKNGAQSENMKVSPESSWRNQVHVFDSKYLDKKHGFYYHYCWVELNLAVLCDYNTFKNQLWDDKVQQRFRQTTNQ